MKELLRVVRQTRPDLVLIDIRMPPSHTSEGLAAASAIRADMPEVGVLVLSQYVDADYALTLLREHPARSGYLLKDRITQLDTLLDAIQRIDRGETVVDRELVELLLNQSATSNRLERLSEREHEVLALVAEGLTDRAIAQRLWLTPRPSRPTSATSSPSSSSPPTTSTTAASSPSSPTSTTRTATLPNHGDGLARSPLGVAPASEKR